MRTARTVPTTARQVFMSFSTVLSPHRSGELTRRFLADPSPVVRVEAIEGAPAAGAPAPAHALRRAAPEARRGAGGRAGGTPRGVVADCLHAAVAGDLRQAPAAGVRAAAEADAAARPGRAAGRHALPEPVAGPPAAPAVPDDSRELTWDAVEPAGGPHE
ncbi:hypothetical protein [Actinoplanes sp. NPDC049599]|uniref:hypothetical protein n=1 Tax=Actinoplanes sp. NPDC049599 TaxID=3363903 RepID=UPI0037B777EC